MQRVYELDASVYGPLLAAGISVGGIIGGIGSGAAEPGWAQAACWRWPSAILVVQQPQLAVLTPSLAPPQACLATGWRAWGGAGC